ncbi:hypothetical protein [Nocardia sp. AG03]|uniref:hypothetical protein n=1 Tax=Nocardia sp. AG03 TaxID=3025312 RepID=UPI0024187BE7|nr:hypothetical protein [Nocardia sp. AG03]
MMTKIVVLLFFWLPTGYLCASVVAHEFGARPTRRASLTAPLPAVVAPSIGRPIRSAEDARAVWERHNGAQPVPTTDHTATAVRRALDSAAREQRRRSQLEAAHRHLEGVAELSWPDAEAAWVAANRAAHAAFRG